MLLLSEFLCSTFRLHQTEPKSYPNPHPHTHTTPHDAFPSFARPPGKPARRRTFRRGRETPRSPGRSVWAAFLLRQPHPVANHRPLLLLLLRAKPDCSGFSLLPLATCSQTRRRKSRAARETAAGTRWEEEEEEEAGGSSALTQRARPAELNQEQRRRPARRRHPLSWAPRLVWS